MGKYILLIIIALATACSTLPKDTEGGVITYDSQGNLYRLTKKSDGSWDVEHPVVVRKTDTVE